jgi:hypothetical protein
MNFMMLKIYKKATILPIKKKINIIGLPIPNILIILHISNLINNTMEQQIQTIFLNSQTLALLQTLISSRC